MRNDWKSDQTTIRISLLKVNGIIKWYGRENTIKNFILVCFVIGKNIYIYFLYIYILYVPVGTLGYRLCQGQSSSGVTYQFKKM